MRQTQRPLVVAPEFIASPALRALIEQAAAHRTVVRWADGEQAVVEYDSPVEADETDDGVETMIVDVIEVPAPGRRRFQAGRINEIRADDPPCFVSSPDGSRTWSARPSA